MYGASVVAQMVEIVPAMQEASIRSLGWEDPWRRDWTPQAEGLPTPEFWPGEFYGQRNLAGYLPWGHKVSDTTEQLTHTNSNSSHQER